MSKIRLNSTNSVGTGATNVYNGTEWQAVDSRLHTSDNKIDMLENKVIELEALIKRLIDQLVPEMKV